MLNQFGAVQGALRFWLTVIILSSFCSSLVAARSPQGSHHDQLFRLASVNQTLHSSNFTSSRAEELVARAHRVLKQLNRALVDNPTFNKQQFADAEVLQTSSAPAPPLNIDEDEIKVHSRQSGSAGKPYTIPPGLAEAARAVAEANAQVPSGDHDQEAIRVREKFRHRTNSTNAPKRQASPEDIFGNSGTDAALVKRAQGYWMVDMAQLGRAPYASQEYQVWRNVKDSGAKGDGITDDTEAINRAITDGSRCGMDCGSSTLTPAVVYFPAGTYLVSSPIIQYFNTQFLGDPHEIPTILAASSFVGLGVITSDVYLANNEQWYLNTANFLRSIRNFKMDIRLTNPEAYICAIHWQVAQATSLENIEFYMLYNSDVPNNTQQGIYMENGSGGFLADLTFVGGNFGAYFGNQQFTTSHLVFIRSSTAVQVHWDWAWTMQDFVIESCTNGLVIVGGAGGDKSYGQGVGSLLLVDAIIANTQFGVVTTLRSERATSFLLQNVGFFNVHTAVPDRDQNQVLVPGGKQVLLDSWGFGLVSNATAKSSTFVDGQEIPSMNRPKQFLGQAYDNMKPNLFTRRRPTYYNEPQSNIINVKAFGAKGDGQSDDTAVLNAVLEAAANTSSIVYFPYGIYIVKDTVRLPVGSRVIGQAWPQIMGRGARFQDELNPRSVVRVSRQGDVGIIEIQDMMFTVGGPTAGAIVVEWNVAESSQGSAGRGTLIVLYPLFIRPIC